MEPLATLPSLPISLILLIEPEVPGALGAADPGAEFCAEAGRLIAMVAAKAAAVKPTQSVGPKHRVYFNHQAEAATCRANSRHSQIWASPNSPLLPEHESGAGIFAGAQRGNQE